MAAKSIAFRAAVFHLPVQTHLRIYRFSSLGARNLHTPCTSDGERSRIAHGKTEAALTAVVQRTQRGETAHWIKLRLQQPASHPADLNEPDRPTVESSNAHDAAAEAADKPSTWRDSARRTLAHTNDWIAAVFLPKNMSTTVTREYLPYSLWAFINSVTGTITGTLSTQALLQALGLGAGTAIGLAATTNWIIKDGFGLLGGVLFAGFMGNRFDASPKYYRFLSNLCIQLSNLVELATPAIPHLFLPLASISNIGKNIGWLASSATRASIHRSFALCDNLGDITAKAGAQATAAGLVGTGGGILLSWTIGTDPVSLLMAFLPLSALNVWATYRSNSAVVTRNMNIERAEICINSILESNDDHAPSPEMISRQETIFGPFKRPFAVPIQLEASIEQTELSRASPSILQAFADGRINDANNSICQGNYRIYIDSDKRCVWLWFLESASPHDITTGFVHACIVRRDLDPAKTALSRPVSDKDPQQITDMISRSGWDVEHTHLGDINRRISFE